MVQRSTLGGAVLILILTTGAAMADLFGKSSLSPEWVERFQDLSKLNAYAVSQPVHLSNVTISGWNISGAKLPGARFEDTEWKDVKLERSVLSNVTFKKTKLQGIGFQQATLTDVIFEDAELRSTSFYKAKLERVRFIRCKFNGVNVDETVESTIEITDSKLLSSSLSEGQLIATMKNSTLKDVEFTDLESPSALTFEKSELKEVNADRAVLTSLRIIGSQVDATFKNAKIDRVEFESSELDTSLSESVITSLTVASSKIKTLRMNSAKIDNVVIRDCEQTKNFGFYKATVRKIDIERSRLNDFDVAKTSVETLRINNSTLSGTDFEELKAKSVSLENISLDGKVDFTNAQIDQLTTKNITKLPGLNLITTGSSVKFD